MDPIHQMIYGGLLFALCLGLCLSAVLTVFFPSGGKVREFLGKNSFRILLISSIFVFLWWWGIGILRHLSLRTSLIDSGTFASMLWNTLHGHLLVTGMTDVNYFNIHFTPSLIVFSLFYAPWQSPMWLAGLMCLGAVSGALGIYMLGKELGLSPGQGLAFGLAWLASAAIRGAAYFDFHEVTMLSGLMVWTVWLGTKRKWFWMMLLALFILGFKEDIPVYVGGLGIILAWSYKRPREGWLLVGMAVAYFFAVQLLLWPIIMPAHLDFLSLQFPQLVEPGQSSISLLLAEPGRLINHLLDLSHLWAFLFFLLPTLFLCFMRPGWLGFIPALWLVLSMKLFSPYIFGNHYPAPVAALILMASVAGFAWLKNNKPSITKLIIVAVPAFAFAINFALPQDMLVAQFIPSMYLTHPEYPALSRFVGITPANFSVSAEVFVGSHLTSRNILYMFPTSRAMTDRIVTTNNSMACPLFILAIGGMNYRSIQQNPCFWFLDKHKGVLAGESYMERMRWTEAEGCQRPDWNIVNDRRASGGKAAYFSANGSWAGRFVRSQFLLLPPGRYSYEVRMRPSMPIKTVGSLIMEVRAIDEAGNDNLIGQGRIHEIPLNASKTNYLSLPIEFTVEDWGLYYLSVNFCDGYDVYWDGVSLRGLDISFDEYYTNLFPVRVSARDSLVSAYVEDNEAPGGWGLELKQIQGQTIWEGDLPADLIEGDYEVYTVARIRQPEAGNVKYGRLIADEVKQTESGITTSTWLICNPEGYFEGYAVNKAFIHLLPRGHVHLRALENIDKNVRFCGLWISRAPAYDYDLFLR